MSEPFFRLLDDVTDQVREDGQARQVRVINEKDEISLQVVFFDGRNVRTCAMEKWPEVKREMARKVEQRKAMSDVRAQVDAMAGKPVDGKDPLPLLILLLERVGALDDDLNVRPVADWGKPLP